MSWQDRQGFDFLTVSEYKMKIDRQRREADFKHKKEIQELEEKLEQAEADKKQVDKKVSI